MSQQPPPFPHQDSTGAAYQPQGFVCPKCRGAMRTYDRNGVHVEQCDQCRGIFLDFGELESLTQLENRFVQSAPPIQPGYGQQGYGQQGYGQGPEWGHRGNKHYRKQGFGRLFFSS